MINREASGLYKALRLQKLRAIDYILNHIEMDEEKDIAVAIEIFEDVYVKIEDGNEIYEQNKDYDPNSTFTLNSEEILKSLCSFIDIWIHNELSPNISFCFLSTNCIGKEATTSRSTSLGLTFPKKKIIKILENKDDTEIDNVEAIIRSIVYDYYVEKFPNQEQTIKTLDALSKEVWVGFLKQIHWIFGHPSVEELETSVLNKIKASVYYSKYYSNGNEETIKSSLIDLVEEKRLKKDKLFQLVHKAHVKLKFSESSNKSNNLASDNVFTLWETIEKPTDTRNLRQKILDVCPDFDESKIAQYERQSAIAKVEESRLKNSHKYLALKFRVFNYCDTNLSELLSDRTDSKFSPKEINIIIDTINKGCVLEFEELKNDFDYGISRNSIVLELFIEFIDSCYLAFN